MKTLLPFFIFLLLISCATNPEKKTINVLNSNENLIADSSKQHLLKIIEGGWVNEEYISVFEKSKSPMEAAAYGLPEQEIAFDISNMNGDTLINAMGRLNYSEAERFDVIFYKQTDGKVAMKIKMDKNYPNESMFLNYSVEGNDTILLLTINEGQTTLTHRYKKQFRIFPEMDGVRLTALEDFANVELFDGEWKDGSKEIYFTENGEVKNFRNFNRYSINLKEDHPESKPDEITFYNDTSAATYTFVCSMNKAVMKMDLYEFKESDDGLKFSREKLVATLVHVDAE